MRLVKWVFLLAFPFVVGILSAERGVAQDKDEQRPPKGQLLEAPEITYEHNRPSNLAKAASPANTIFEEDFEGEVSGWTEEGVWSIGEPTSGPGGGFESPSAGATNLSGDYPNDSDARLISPSISLPEVSSSGEILLHFREWFEIESEYDEGNVEISTDGGSTWTQLSSRSGSSDWRDTQVDLMSYAGEEVRLAFRFDSDFSITFPGWYVDDVQVSVDEPEPLSANITGLNPQKFPFIFSNVEVDTSGSGIGDLSESNFEVYENGTLQTDQFEVVPPEEGGGVRQTDVVFLIDNTGSMDDEIAQVRDNVIAFVDSLESSEIDFSLGLITYKDDVTTYFGGTLTSNASEFQETVGDLSATGGNSIPENGLGALQVGLNSISFRPGSQKVFVLITDAPSHTPPPPYEDPPDPEPPSLSEINQSMNEAGVTTYAAAIDDPIYKGEGSITNDTGGSFFFVTEPFDSILDDIGEEVSDSYVVRYRSGNDDRDGSERTVRVEVNYEGNTAQDTANYVAGGFPQIVRTEETRALEDQTWTEGTEFTIEAEITDNIAPSVQEATVFYKTTSDPTSAYESTAMSAVNDSLYEATIPGSAVDSPGLDYYITATDGEVTSSLPSTNPANTPYQIAILPNEPPEIEHTPATEFTPNSPIPISATIVDNTDSLASTTLYYQQVGNLTYTSVEMTNTSGDVYEGEIPGSAVTDVGIQYYIEATDNFDVRNTEGTADNPIEVTDLFAGWPDLKDPSITLKVVHPTTVPVDSVHLSSEVVGVFAKEEEATSNTKPISSGVLKSTTENGQTSSFFAFDSSKVANRFYEGAVDDDKFNQIQIYNSNEDIIGFLPFRYTESDFEEGGCPGSPDGKCSVDAIAYLHAEEALRPELNTDRWSSEWDYYESTPDISEPYPLSMLVPPKGNVNNADPDEKEPVVLVHGVSGRYPSWGNDIETARNLVGTLSDEGYDAWQFYYPENQDITKSGPLLAKAIHQLQTSLGYGAGQSFDIVAHSMGGLVSRHYVQRMGIGSEMGADNERQSYSDVLSPGPEGFNPGEPGENIGNFLMLGTPNHGSYAAYKCTPASFTECVFLDKDIGAPAYRQMTPGSKFLDEINRSGEVSEPYSSSSTLVLAGTENPIELINKEIDNQADGVVAASSANLLDIGVPFATGNFAHSEGVDRTPVIDYEVLNEDTYDIISYFLSSDYEPDNLVGQPSEPAGINYFWTSFSDGPGPTEVNFNGEAGIVNLTAPGVSVGGFDVAPATRIPPLVTKSCDVEGNPVFVKGGNDMTKVPEEAGYFSTAEGIDFGFGDGAGDELESGVYGIPISATRSFSGNSYCIAQKVNVTYNYLQNSKAYYADLSEGQKLVLNSGGSIPTASIGKPSIAGANTGVSPASKEQETEESNFHVRSSADTLAFWLAGIQDEVFSENKMRLVTPNGTVIDSTEAKNRSGYTYSQSQSLGFALYYVESPGSGRWSVRYNSSVEGEVITPVSGTIGLTATTPDSSFLTGEIVPLTVSLSEQNTYQDAKIDAHIQVIDPEDGETSKLGTVELNGSSPTTYEGTFSPSYVGSYQVAIDFSARVNGEAVRRRAVETVMVTGDSTNTVPDPPEAPTDLSVEFDKSDGVTLNWSANGSGSVEEYRIYRDTIPNPVRQVATVPSGQTTYTDSEARRGQTYYYRVTAAGTEGVESVYTDASSIFAYPSSLPVQIERTFGDAEAEEDYRLVALPGQASSSLGETVSDDWRGFREEGTSEDQPYSRSECEGNCQFGPGEGFWLITDQSWEVNQTVNTVPLTEAKTTQVDLQEGWNIISNPLGVEVAWNAVQAASGTNQPLWRWDGTWEQTQTFAAATGGEAYYFRSDSLSQLTIPYPGTGAASSPQSKTDTAETEEKTLTLSAVRGDRRLSTIEAGVRPDAKEGLDAFDQYGPPGYFGEATLRLIQDEDGRRRVLATEYASPDGEGNAFDVVLRAQPDTVLTLRADGLENIPGGEAALVNQETGETHDLMQDREATVVPQAGETRYRLLVGRSSFVDRKQQEIKPEEVKLLANYPNPFRTGTTIEYALPEDADVRLAVYDVLGRQVAVLEEGRRESGFHRVRWDVGDQSLSSGVYFYRLRAGDKTESRRMVVLR